jgi:DNA-directed RNA polymerase beta subunit
MARNRQVFPAECRERHVTYRGRLSATLEFRINGGDPVEFTREFGQVPVMIKVCILIPAVGVLYSPCPVEPMPSREQLTCAPC